MINLAKLIAVSQPADDDAKWLSGAEEGIDYLISQLAEDETIIFAALRATLIQAVLAPRDQVTPADQGDLIGTTFFQDRTWSIAHESGGGEADRVYLADPLDHPGCKSLLGGEALVFRRYFNSVDKGNPRTEVSQKLVHSLGLYWLEEVSAYCRLDEQGDVEPVLCVVHLQKHTGRDGDIVVTIKARDLARYMVVTNTALVWKFDFTRFEPGRFGTWGSHAEFRVRGPDLFYNATSQGGASYANGIVVSRTRLTYQDIVDEYRERWDPSAKQYATFKAYDWKNRKLAEISCAPTALASYFEPESPLPFQITPAFFRPDVLQRYKADPEKYTLEHRSVNSRAGWSLKTYDINEAGQVHTYLHYLGDLPHQEQLYWQSFNEWPKAGISKRAYLTDIQGEWTDIPDPLIELISKVRELDDKKPDWWLVRGEGLRKVVHYPVTTSPDEWGNSLLALDQMLVEGFGPQPVRARLHALSRAFEKEWGSLRLLQELLIAQGWAPSDATDAIEPLRRLHMLRSKIKGHSGDAERRGLIAEARADHGSLKDHFVQLAFDCQEAFEVACAAMNRLASSNS
ncbi:MAG TPA: hypothetical protein VMG08_17235 [Allosphingosinicella sp.]|nr:hypothetical protein [Allosphingosinicella sp.]